METTAIIETTAPVTEGTVTTEEEIMSETVLETIEVSETARDYWTPENLMGKEGTVPIMGKGMLGIFIVTTIIVTVTVVLNKATAPRKKNKEKKDK